MSFEEGLPGVVSLCRAYLIKVAKCDVDDLLQRLDCEIGQDYDTWSRRIAAAFAWQGESIKPSHDVVTYAIEHISQRKSQKEKKHNTLLSMALKLSEDSFFFALAVYADRKGDVEGVKRAWDASINRQSLYRVLLRQFRARSDGGRTLARRNWDRDKRIKIAYESLATQAISHHEIISTLAKEYELAKPRVRQIVNKI
jgi:hypothetical protein